MKGDERFIVYGKPERIREEARYVIFTNLLGTYKKNGGGGG
jgi:hypothetical protein